MSRGSGFRNRMTQPPRPLHSRDDVRRDLPSVLASSLFLLGIGPRKHLSEAEPFAVFGEKVSDRSGDVPCQDLETSPFGLPLLSGMIDQDQEIVRRQVDGVSGEESELDEGEPAPPERMRLFFFSSSLIVWSIISAISAACFFSWSSSESCHFFGR